MENRDFPVERSSEKKTLPGGGEKEKKRAFDLPKTKSLLQRGASCH